MALKVAMHNWMRPEPIEVTIKRLGRSGYDGIEISGEPALYDTKQVRSLLEENGLECWGAVTLMVGGRDLLHEDKYVRIGSVEYVKDTIDMIKDLGGKILTVVPSTVGKVTPMGSPEEEWLWAVESLKECQDYAEKQGVRLGLEPLNRFETYFLNRGDQALALAEDVGGDCGICLDIFHMNIEEADWPTAIRNAGDKLVDFHIADNNRMPPGQGAIDWELLVRTLEDVGYDGYLTVEFVATVDRSRISQRREIGDASEADASVGLEQFLRDHGTGAVPEQLYDEYVQESIDTLRRHIGAQQAARAKGGKAGGPTFVQQRGSRSAGHPGLPGGEGHRHGPDREHGAARPAPPARDGHDPGGRDHEAGGRTRPGPLHALCVVRLLPPAHVRAGCRHRDDHRQISDPARGLPRRRSFPHPPRLQPTGVRQQPRVERQDHRPALAAHPL